MYKHIVSARRLQSNLKPNLTTNLKMKHPSETSSAEGGSVATPLLAVTPPWHPSKKEPRQEPTMKPLVPGTKAYEDHMVEVMLLRERKLNEVAKLMHQAQAAESREATLAAKKEQAVTDNTTRDAATDVPVYPMKRKLEPGPAVAGYLPADTLA